MLIVPVATEQVGCAVTLAVGIAGVVNTTTKITGEVLEHPDVTVLRNHVVCVNAPGLKSLVVAEADEKPVDGPVVLFSQL